MTDPIGRLCDGCGQTDTAPRVTHVVDAADTSKDLLFHYDCVPYYVEEAHPDLAAGIDAAKAGKRGDDLLAAIAAANPYVAPSQES